ncbi:MAG TPA: A/G-specific adenine glycosylase [Dehalococcoidia bacterium]|nr:A/G-specific adenine glycosylase [Dehalococcoidia bacterium]
MESVPEIAALPDVRRALLRWHRAHGLHAPWRESGNPYETLVAAVMAQQTQMSRVMPAYERFIAAFPTVEALAGASPGAVIRAWSGMGYNARAVRLHRAARTIAATGWPRDAASLARIDGIGPFTAAVIASFAFGQRAACVDTNVRRVLGRLAGDETLDGARLQQLADRSLAVRAPARWNQALMDYGARVCTPRPDCGGCAVARWCASRERYMAPRSSLGEKRGVYRAGPRKPAYAGSPRWYRGRIIEVLRALPPGGSVPVRSLPRRIERDGRVLAPAETWALVAALERAGLVVLHRGRVALPE